MARCAERWCGVDERDSYVFMWGVFNLSVIVGLAPQVVGDIAIRLLFLDRRVDRLFRQVHSVVVIVLVVWALFTWSDMFAYERRAIYERNIYQHAQFTKEVK